MTITLDQMWFFLGTMIVLVVSPGPVVAAVIARVLGRGFHAAWPITLAVMAGDFLWVAIAVLGVSEFISGHANIMFAIRIGGALYLAYLGIQEIRNAGEKIEAANIDKSQRFWPVFIAGFVIIMTNPKAILFYMLIVPNYFEVSEFTKLDILFVALAAASTAFAGNMIWASFANIASKQIASERGRRIMRQVSGSALIIVAVALIFIK